MSAKYGSVTTTTPDVALRDALDAALVLFAWESGAVTFAEACRALGVTHDELYDLEMDAADYGRQIVGGALAMARDGRAM